MTDFVKRAAKIAGRTIAVLFLLPFCAAGAALRGAAFFLQEFWNTFAGDIAESLKVPDRLPPVGMGGFGARLVWGIKALRAEAEGNEDEAVKYWKECARRFDAAAMLKLAKHYERAWDEDGNEAGDKKLASQWCAVAAGLGSAEGEAEYVRLTSLELTDREKAWLRRNFIKYRAACLRD